MKKEDVTIPLFSVNMDIVDVHDDESGMVRYKVYPSEIFVDYTHVMSENSCATILAILAQVVIDKKPDSEQETYKKNVVSIFNKMLEDVVMYDKENFNEF
jgi:hypothetical protein